MNNQNTLVMALGGLGEVGKNMYVVTHENELIIIDAGVMFPKNDLLGIDYVIPDFTYLKRNEKKIKCLIITHGHEDHIGGIPFLLQTINVPVIYAPKQAIVSITKKLEEKNIKLPKIITYNEDTIIKYHYMSVEFFRTTHSIPDSHGVVVNTPNGTIVETGDFKFDFRPIGPMANLSKMAKIGDRGVRLLMSDSTNALAEGMSFSESNVDGTINDLFARQTGRIILATFASNVYRVKHIIETCQKYNRKVALFGKSMETSVETAFSSGYLDKNLKNSIINIDDVKKYKPENLCLLCTGSQGEPLAALTRIANGSHKQIHLQPDDIVIFSSSPIPGNGISIGRTINKLYMKGVKVYTNTSISDIHTTGHAHQEELRLMLRLIRPEYFMPIHGEYRMLKNHADLGVECGIPKEKTFILENGQVVVMNKDIVKVQGQVPANDIYVDGNRIGDIGGVVLRDRKVMSSDGILAIIACIDVNNGELLSKPTITTRGFVLVNESEKLIKEIENHAESTIKNYNIKKSKNDLKNEITNEVSLYIYEKTGRKPLVIPVIINIQKQNKE